MRFDGDEVCPVKRESNAKHNTQRIPGCQLDLTRGGRILKLHAKYDTTCLQRLRMGEKGGTVMEMGWKGI